jgi:AcrR family transcriptional regulator
MPHPSKADPALAPPALSGRAGGLANGAVNRPVKVALNTVLDGVTKGAVSTPSRGPGRHTLDNILRAAGEILDEAGYEGFNTTAVAQRAGISTATLYRHYPDKHAVLRALIVHEQTERSAALGPFFEAFATAADWRTPLAEATRHIWRMRLAQPGGRATRRALQMSPDLWQWDQRQNEEIAQGFARAMRRRNPKLSAVKSRRVALVSVQAMVSLLDLASLDPRLGPRIVEEAIEMRAAYLAPYLDAAGS